jgi:hypothetical protein
MVVFAWMTHQEKAYYADAAFYVFQMVNHEQLPMEHHRYMAVPAYIVSFLMQITGAKIEAVTPFFSAGLWMVCLLIFLWMIQVKAYVEGTALVLLLSFFIRESFFIASEVPLSIGYALLYGAYCRGMRTLPSLGRSIHIMGWVAAAGCAFSHPYGMVLGLIFTVLHSLENKQSLLLTWLPLGILLAIRWVFFPMTSYESDHMERLLAQFGSLSGSYALHFFSHTYGILYLLTTFLWLYTVVRRRKRAVSRAYSLWLLLVYPLLWLSVMLVYAQGDVHPAMERSFLLFVAPSVYFYLFDIERDYKGFFPGMITICWVISLMGLQQIINSSEIYSRRLYELDLMVNKTTEEGGGKMYIYDKELSDDIWLVKWALPFESALMSMKQGKGVATSVIQVVRQGDEGMLKPYRFHGPDFYYPYHVDSLNTSRFQLDTLAWKKLHLIRK